MSPADPRVEELARAMWEERVGIGPYHPDMELTWEQLEARGGESGGLAGLYLAKASSILPRLGGL